MLQAGLQDRHIAVQHLIGLGDGIQGHGLVVIVQVLIEQKGVVPLLLGLNFVPVGKAVQSTGLKVVGEVQIQISGVELLVHLLVQQLFHFCVQHMSFLHLKILGHSVDFTTLIIPHLLQNTRKTSLRRIRTA